MLYRVDAMSARPVGGAGPVGSSKDVELLVLRHEDQVLFRQLGDRRMRWDHVDRLWFATLSRPVNRPRWTEIFPVTPATILRRRRRRSLVIGAPRVAENASSRA